MPTPAPQTVSVRHNFETAHRLPFLGGKCTNLHGHSWRVEVTIGGAPDAEGILMDFGSLKRNVRGWVDEHLDHGAMLGAGDPLLPAFRADGTKVFVFDPGDPSAGSLTAGYAHLRPLAWPTVENVAELLRRYTTALLGGPLDGDPAGYTVHVAVSETATNTATAGRLP